MLEVSSMKNGGRLQRPVSTAGRAKKEWGENWEGLGGYGSGLKAGDNAIIKSSARTSKKRK